MRRILAVLLAAIFAAWAAVDIKLYLNDGDYHLVREYKVDADRVRFYSVERSQWEEIPLSLVDLKRTQTEAAAKVEKFAKDTKSLAAEDAERKALRKEVMRIPQDAGVYWLAGEETRSLKTAESTVRTDKGRKILRYLSGVPQMMNDKGVLEIQGAHSLNVFTDPQQEFYIQLSVTEGFGIIKLTPKTGVRTVEDLIFESLTKEVQEQPIPIEIIQQELAPGGLYKIWAKDPLPSGEYAVAQYTPGKMDMQIWDFGIKAK